MTEPPRYELVVRPAAFQELQDLAGYIALDSRSAGVRLVDAALETMERLRVWPEAHPLYEPQPPHLPGLRKVAVRGFPNHLIFFRVRDGIVEVVRVLHAARDLEVALEE